MIYRTIVETPIENELTDEKKKILAMKIEDIDLSIRSSIHLRRAGINTVADLVSKTEEDIMQLPRFGKKCFNEVKSKLNELGVDFDSSQKIYLRSAGDNDEL